MNQPTARPPAPPTFGDAALSYFRDRAIDPALAAALGVTEAEGAIVFRCAAADGSTFERRRPLNGSGPAKVMQPRGKPLAPWWPAGVPERAEWALVCEGESDALAAVSALRRSPACLGLHDLPVVAVPGTGFSPERLAEALVAVGAREVRLVLDADDAGRRYTERAIKELREVDIRPFLVVLPDGGDLAGCAAAADDPGEWIANVLLDAEDADGSATASAPVEPPDTADVLGEVGELVAKYVVLPSEHEVVAVTLWAAHTWAFEGAHATPYLLVVSPERRSGKTRLLEVLELLVRSPWRIASASEAAMFRKINDHRPTLLLDEIDAIFGSATERTEPLRAVLNAGNRPGSSVARCVGEGAKQTVVDFSVYCPKVLAGIDTGRVPDTIVDRSIRLAMKRKTGTEPTSALRHRHADAEARPVRERLEAWGAANAAELLVAEPDDIPAGLDDRAAEAWEPLLAITDLAGGKVPAQARRSGRADRRRLGRARPRHSAAARAARHLRGA